MTRLHVKVCHMKWLNFRHNSVTALKYTENYAQQKMQTKKNKLTSIYQIKYVHVG